MKLMVFWHFDFGMAFGTTKISKIICSITSFVVESKTTPFGSTMLKRHISIVYL